MVQAVMKLGQVPPFAFSATFDATDSNTYAEGRIWVDQVPISMFVA